MSKPCQCSTANQNKRWEISIVVYAEGLLITMKFQVIDASLACNLILGRPRICNIKGMLSTYHQMIKSPTPWGVHSTRGKQLISKKCYITDLVANLPQLEMVNVIEGGSWPKPKPETYMMEPRHIYMMEWTSTNDELKSC